VQRGVVEALVLRLHQLVSLHLAVLREAVEAVEAAAGEAPVPPGPLAPRPSKAMKGLDTKALDSTLHVTVAAIKVGGGWGLGAGWGQRRKPRGAAEAQ
jgi:hypothetical protein